MATTKTTTPDTDIYLAKPSDALDIKQWYDSGDEYTAGIDTAQVITDIDTEAATLKAGYPYASQEALDAAVDAAMNAIKTSIATNVTAPTFHDILDVVNADMIGVIQGDTTTFPPAGAIYVCPECSGDGKRENLETDGTPTGIYQRSELCDGFGYTEVQYIKNPNTDYIEAP